MSEIRRFTRTPFCTGADDPERSAVRGILQLGETVIIETAGFYSMNKGRRFLRPRLAVQCLEKIVSRPGILWRLAGDHLNRR